MESDREVLAALAERAREAWDDPSCVVPRDRFVNRDNDEEIVGWAYEHEVAL